MSHFYGTIAGARESQATKTGTKKTGLTAIAASYDGAVSVYLWRDEKNNCDRFRVTQIPWQGVGAATVLSEGIVGKKQESM